MLRSDRLRRVRTRLLFCLAAMTPLVAAVPIARASTINAASVTLRYAVWDNASLTRPITQPCLAKLPNIKLKLELIPRNGFEIKLQTEFAGGTAPDIIHSPENVTSDWARQGQILDQTPYLKALGIALPKVVPQALWHSGNKYLGTSYGLESLHLLYNKQAFKAAGLPTPPTNAAHAWTWSQFVAIAQKLTVDRQGRHPSDPGFDSRHIKQYGVYVSDGWGALLPLISSNGGSAYDATYTHFTMDQPAATAVVQAVADLVNKYHVMPMPSAAYASGAGNISLGSGRLGMELASTWHLWYYTSPKDFQMDIDPSVFQLGIGVLPVFKTYSTMLEGPPEVVWAKTSHPKEAVQMAACLGGQSLAGAQLGVWLPTSNNLLFGKGYSSWATSAAHPSNFRSAAVDTIKYAKDLPFYHMAKFDETWTNLIQPALDKTMGGNATAQQALSAVKSQVNSVLAHS